MNTSHASLLSFLASSARYEPHKWPQKINFVLPISLRQMEGKTKGKLIRA